MPEQRETYSVGEPVFRSPAEIMLVATEELGEVAQEVALLEHIGTKASWEKEPSRDRLTVEIRHTMNCLLALAAHYGLDLGEPFPKKL